MWALFWQNIVDGHKAADENNQDEVSDMVQNVSERRKLKT